MKKVLIGVLLLLVSLAVAAYCWTSLPENVIIQLGFKGLEANTAPKLLAVGCPLVISVGCGLMYMTDKDDRRGKSIIGVVAGLIIMVLELLFNR